MNYCCGDALFTYSSNDTVCVTRFGNILVEKGGEGGDDQSDLCSICNEYLCFGCGQCHMQGCSRSLPLQDSCWVGSID